MKETLESLLHPWLLRLIGLGRYQKRVILAVSDFLVLGLALWIAMSARLGELYLWPSWGLFLIFCAAPAIGVGTFFRLGLYRLVTRYISGQGALLIPVAVGLSALVWALLVLLSGVQTSGTQAVSGQGVQVIPRSVIILYPILGSAFVWGTRQVGGFMLRSVGVELTVRSRENIKTVLIYGAGTTGVQLLDELRRSGAYEPIGFIDMSPTLWGMYVGGLKVYRPERLPSMVQRRDVREVLLAMPMARRRERRAALRQLETLAVSVRTLPAIEDLASGRVTVNDLRPVGAEDLLGRDPVPPNATLLARNIQGKSVMVTGAGGSIGSELVRQILRQDPRRLVLLDAGEGALYEIEREALEGLRAREAARSNASAAPKVVAVLGSIQNSALVRRTIESNAVETIYHAAAYKHVPIVEHNAVAGLSNNTFGTAALADAAQASGVERFVLVSTDKAVRPTSIMGASKRLAEMVLQARSATGYGKHTVFTMVRFGNVLDSSGSVVRMFRRQIEAGGPVTVTHPDAIRYFMSIPEAAALVIQAGAMATGGDVFVLDMDEPVKIDDLAKSMIRLMGLEVRDEQHPDGDIAIEYIGLRHGEKLHEELLLGENTTPTEHAHILRSHEPCMAAAELARVMDALRAAMDANDLTAIHATLMRAVEGYCPERRHLARGPSGNGPATVEVSEERGKIAD
ncbi:MAG TPA: nucleoside-diphosphate sugar epimerase/dehydratase [Hyphomicrobiaceae bacterium]|nr:nucleoside-diphosphate sugar epimerase/dehydratase [Hyphomicrobiaceae bacterium]